MGRQPRASCYDSRMARITITVPDERYMRLKSHADLQHTTVADLIEKELAEAEADRLQRVLAILGKARANAAAAEPCLSDDELMELAVEETHAVRREMTADRNARSHR